MYNTGYIIAVDFDGTLSRAGWPYCGDPNIELINKLINLRKEGVKVILWSCRSGIEEQAAVEWCKRYGLEFDAVNQNLPELVESWGGEDTRKIYADEYWDDKSVKILFDKELVS